MLDAVSFVHGRLSSRRVGALSSRHWLEGLPSRGEAKRQHARRKGLLFVPDDDSSQKSEPKSSKKLGGVSGHPLPREAPLSLHNSPYGSGDEEEERISPESEHAAPRESAGGGERLPRRDRRRCIRAQYHRFLTALSLRPGSKRAIRDQQFPSRACPLKNTNQKYRIEGGAFSTTKEKVILRNSCFLEGTCSSNII